MTLTSTPMILLLRLGSFLALAAMLVGCPSTSPLDAGDQDTGVEDDATVHSDGSMDALGPDADVHLRIDVPMVEVPADRPVPVACMVSAVVDLNARGAADGGVLRYVGDNRSALRTPSLPPTCVSSKINEGQYQVVHRYVPRISGRMRVSLDDQGTDASFDTVLSAQSECFALLPGERSTQVVVLGTVRAPGLYVVSEGTDLGELLGLTGGPNAGALSNEVERTTTIRLFRATAGGTREVIYERTDEAFARDASGYPVVLDGDTVEVTTTERRLRTYRDTLTLVGGVATVIIAVVQIVTIFR